MTATVTTIARALAGTCSGHNGMIVQASRDTLGRDLHLCIYELLHKPLANLPKVGTLLFSKLDPILNSVPVHRFLRFRLQDCAKLGQALPTTSKRFLMHRAGGFGAPSLWIWGARYVASYLGRRVSVEVPVERGQ